MKLLAPLSRLNLANCLKYIVLRSNAPYAVNAFEDVVANDADVDVEAYDADVAYDADIDEV